MRLPANGGIPGKLILAISVVSIMNYLSESRGSISSFKVIIAAAVFLVLFDNTTFFTHVADFYPLSQKNFLFLISLVFSVTGLVVMVLLPLCFQYTTKPVLILILIVSSLTSYFMDSYNTVIDTSMIRNVFNTNLDEVLDLLNLKLFLYLTLLGILPSLAVYKTRIHYFSLWREISLRSILLITIFLNILLLILSFGNYYSSFFREHKSLRYYSNPDYYLYSVGKYVSKQFTSMNHTITPLGLDAKIPVSGFHRKLVIFVVGEAARYDRFSLNGYKRQTNPLLSMAGVISFTNFWSCGTSTAVSVPCMFSEYRRRQFTAEKGLAEENILDVLSHAGVNVLWLDNNSSSKGVADRVAYVNYRNPDTNHVCDVECRDEGMLLSLQNYINKQKHGDIFIVLHQMGNHGPDYYRRYPAKFEKFTPVCRSNLLEECSNNEINNAYDNAILYTDYFLNRVIELLKRNNGSYETAMFYVSDHGESLGEHGIYLHGLPYILAPETQTHIPAIMWISKNFYGLDAVSLTKIHNNKYTHDNIFHTILGLLGIRSSVYAGNLDIIHDGSGNISPGKILSQKNTIAAAPTVFSKK